MNLEYTWVNIRSIPEGSLHDLKKKLNKYDVFYSADKGLHNKASGETRLCAIDIIDEDLDEVTFFYANRAGDYRFLDSLSERYPGTVEWVILRENGGVADLSSHATRTFNIDKDILSGAVKPSGDITLIKSYVSLAHEVVLGFD